MLCFFKNRARGTGGRKLGVIAMRLVEINKSLYINLDTVAIIALRKDEYGHYFSFSFTTDDEYGWSSQSFNSEEAAQQWFEEHVLPLVPTYSKLNRELKIDGRWRRHAKLNLNRKE